MPVPIRRSLRERKANPKYLNSTWDLDTLKLLRASSDSNSDSHSNISDSNQNSSDEDVDAVASPDPGFAEPAAEQEADESSDTSQHSQSHIQTPQDSDHDVSSATSGGPRPRKRRRIYAQRPSSAADTSHSRGIKHVHRKRAKTIVYSELFGPSLHDLTPVLKARDVWLHARDITLPSRETLSTTLCRQQRSSSPPGLSEEVVSKLDTAIAQQVVEQIETDDRGNKFFLKDVSDQKIALGPWGSQKCYDAEYLKPLKLGVGWQNIADNSMVEEANLPADLTSTNSYHQGWLINVGSKVQCLAWTPNSISNQYLAVASKATSKQRDTVGARSTHTAPAFTHSPSFPTSIQVWKFQTLTAGNHQMKCIDHDASPWLVMNLGIEYGEIRQLQWAPPSTRLMDDKEDRLTTPRHQHLLSILSSDGRVRILDITLSNDEGITTDSLHVKSPTFDILPPESNVFTALAWISPTDIAVGASDGTLRLYNICSMALGQSSEPYFTYQLHNTYIMCLCPALPSESPTFLASSSAAGDILLTDLRNPLQDRVHLPKARLPTKALIYSPFTRSFITTVDHSGMTEPKGSSQSSVVCHHLRHFYTSLQLARLPEMSGSATALAGSVHHPSILIGNAKGTVFVTNYLRKALPSTRASMDVKQGTGAFLQKICEYEWQPTGQDQQSRDLLNVDLFHGHDVRPGISRFHEGFKPEQIDFTTSGTKAKKKETREHEFAAEVIFEEEQAVTAMDWNSNSNCAGWVAIGWGSGIVRVQDLAYDAS